MTISISQPLEVFYDNGNNASRINLPEGVQDVDDKFGAYLMETYPDIVKDSLPQNDVTVEAPEEVPAEETTTEVPDETVETPSE